MKNREKWIQTVKSLYLKKDSLLICVLSGILLLVIAWPVSEKNDHHADKSVLWDSNGSIINPVNEDEAVDSNSGEWKEDAAAAALEKRLEEILSTMEGVGRVKVMVTLASSREKIIEKDVPTSRSNVLEEDAQGGNRSTQDVEAGESTVYLKTENGEQIPYVIKEISPVIEGVSVVAEGGGDALIQKNITEVIQALFGIEVHKIKVVKMKQQG